MNGVAERFSGLSPVKRVVTLGLAFLGISSLASAGTPPLPVISNQVFAVTNTAFAGGALGNGVSNSAAAINAAITFASSHGGGTVEIPPVGTLTNYLSGPITMASHVNLQIDNGAMLRMFPMITWTNLYGTSTPFVTASSLTDIEISGSGTMDGQGTNWWVPVGTPNEVPRPNFINIGGCTRVLIQNVKLQNPPTFTIYMKSSDTSVTIQGITINTPFDSHNTDGFDITSTNVLIQNSYISTGDDNIEIGGTGAAATDITVSNCTFGTGHGLSIGSYTGGGVNNLLVSNCTWNGTEYGIKMKTDRDRGGLMENLKYLDLTMTNVNFPFAFYMYYNSMGSPSKNITNTPASAATDTPHSITSTTPIFRNVTISNLTAVGNSGIQGPGNIAGIIFGLPESPVTNVTLCKVNILGRSSDGTFCIYNARGIKIIDSNLTAPTTGTNTLTLYNAEVIVTNSAANTNLVTIGGLGSPSNSVLSFFNGKAAITDTNVDGARPITLGGSTLTFNQGAASFSNNLNVVAASTLAFASGSNTFSGVPSGSGPLTINLPANSLLTVQSNWSGFVGTMAITNSGMLRFNQAANSWGDSNATFDAGSSGTINNRSTNNITIFLGALTGGSGSKLRGSDQAGPGVDTYVIGGLNSNTTFAGTITDGTSSTTPHTVALTKMGNGTFTLSGTNSYSGGTTVSNGTLLVNNSNGSATGTGAVTVVNAATLGGSGVIGGPVTVNGTLAPGNGTGTLTISNSLAVNGGAVLQYSLGTTGDLTVVSGDLTLGGTLNVTDAGGFTNMTYTLFSYGGSLAYNGLAVGTTPNTNFTYTVSTNVVGQVNLIVSGGGGGTPPVAGFTASLTNGLSPLTVTFTDASTGTISNWFWDFGDGNQTNFAVSTNPAHTYATGAYTVTLIVSGSAGLSTNVQSNLITALDPFAAWQLQFFNCTSCPQAAPDADPLGKGMSNTNQFLAGLNPTNSASALRITSTVQQTTDVVITWTTASGRTNAAQASAGDASGGYTNNFTDISGSIVITGNGDTTTNYVDGGGATNSPSRYYRIRLVP